MANALDWTFRLTDRVSAPARSAAAGVGDFVQSMHSAMAIMDYTLRGAEALGRGLVSAIAPAVAREKTLGAFETLLGTAEKARDMYGQALQFASATPFEAPEVIKAFQSLLTAHIDPVEVPIAMEIVGDATSMAQNSAEALNTVIMQMGQMRSLGKMTMEDLKPIMQATMMDGTKFYQNLAKLYGVSVEQIRDMQSKGQISAEAGSFAVLETLQQQFSGNMKRASMQVGGLWSTITSYPAQYLEAIENTQGYEVMRRALKGIADVFDPMSVRGQLLLGVIEQFGGGLLERIFGDSEGDRAQRVFEAVYGGIELTREAAFGLVDGLRVGLGSLVEFNGQTTDLEQMRATFEALGKSIGAVAQGLDIAGGSLKAFFGWFYDFGDWLTEHEQIASLVFGGLLFNPTAAMATGSWGEGFNQSTLGLALNPEGGTGREYSSQEDFSRHVNMVSQEGGHTSAWQMVDDLQKRRAEQAGVAVGEGYVDGMDAGVRLSLGINSPSRVAQGLGEEAGSYTGQGMAQGLQWGLEGEAGGAGGAPSVSIVLNYTAGDDEDRSDNVARQVEEGVLAAFERWSLQTGRRGA